MVDDQVVQKYTEKVNQQDHLRHPGLFERHQRARDHHSQGRHGQSGVKDGHRPGKGECEKGEHEGPQDDAGLGTDFNRALLAAAELKNTPYRQGHGKAGKDPEIGVKRVGENEDLIKEVRIFHCFGKQLVIPEIPYSQVDKRRDKPENGCHPRSPVSCAEDEKADDHKDEPQDKRKVEHAGKGREETGRKNPVEMFRAVIGDQQVMKDEDHETQGDNYGIERELPGQETHHYNEHQRRER